MKCLASQNLGYLDFSAAPKCWDRVKTKMPDQPNQKIDPQNSWNENLSATWEIKTDSAQRSSNKCKKYLLKNYSWHGNILNAIWNISL